MAALIVVLLVATQFVSSQETSDSGGVSSQDAVTSQAAEASPTGDGASENDSPLREEESFVFASDNEPDMGATGDPDINAFGVWDLVRMVLVLLMVVAAIYGLIALLRKRVRPQVEEESSPIRILASKSVGENEIHAVMIGSQVIVLGGGASGLELITRIEDQETIDELVLSHSTGTATQQRGRTFGSVLAGWLGNIAVPGTNTTGGSARFGTGSSRTGASSTSKGGDTLSFLRSQQERLRNLR